MEPPIDHKKNIYSLCKSDTESICNNVHIRELNVRHCPNLVNIYNMVCLQNLVLIGCENFKKITDIPSLRSIRCQKMTMNKVYNLCSVVKLFMMSAVIDVLENLESLDTIQGNNSTINNIINCNNITIIEDCVVNDINNLSKLQYANITSYTMKKIDSCPNLRHLNIISHELMITDLPSLTTLIVTTDCDLFVCNLPIIDSIKLNLVECLSSSEKPECLNTNTININCNVIRISNLYNAGILNIFTCNKLRYISGIYYVENIIIQNCEYLIELHAENVDNITITNCNIVSFKLKNVNSITFSNCKLHNTKIFGVKQITFDECEIDSIDSKTNKLLLKKCSIGNLDGTFNDLELDNCDIISLYKFTSKNIIVKYCDELKEIQDIDAYSLNIIKCKNIKKLKNLSINTLCITGIIDCTYYNLDKLNVVTMTSTKVPISLIKNVKELNYNHCDIECIEDLNVETLRVYRCNKLKSIYCDKARTMIINECNSLHSIESSVENIKLECCDEICNIRCYTIQNISIMYCKKLTTLNNLPNLKHVATNGSMHLHICGTDDIQKLD